MRKMAMAGKKSFVNQRGAMPTLLDMTNHLGTGLPDTASLVETHPR
jgi:hypothetical protein